MSNQCFPANPIRFFLTLLDRPYTSPIPTCTKRERECLDLPPTSSCYLHQRASLISSPSPTLSLHSTPLHSAPAPLHLPQPPSPSSHPIQLPNQLLRNTLQLLSSPPLRTHYRPFSSGCSVEETYMSRGE